MNPKLEQILTEQANIEKELEQLQHRNQRLDNRRKYLMDGARKERTHRLITRGAAIESILPAVQPMTERAFYELMEELFSLPEVQSFLHSHLSKADSDP